MSTPRNVTTELRHQAFSLLKQCFTTLLLAAFLLTVQNTAVKLVRHVGDQAGQQAYDAIMDEFHRDNPHPSDAEMQALEDHFQSGSWQTPEALRPAIEHISDEYFIQWEAKDAQTAAERGWTLASCALDLLLLPLAGLITVALYRALLIARSGNDCAPRMVFAWEHRPKTAVWLQFNMALRLLFWAAIGMFAMSILETLPFVGNILGMLTLLAIVGAAVFHYALAPMFLASDESGRSANACIDESANAMNEFGFIAALRVLWPALIPFAVKLLLSAANVWLPIPYAVFLLLDAPADIACRMYVFAALFIIHEHMGDALQASGHETFVRMRDDRLAREADEDEDLPDDEDEF